MKTQIAPPHLRKALRASMSILALSLTSSPALGVGADYSNQNVDGESFSLKKLIDSTWENASAVGTIFHGANLTRANFTNANLTGAEFSDANLTGANLKGATIQGANFFDLVGNDSAAKPSHTVTHDMLKSTKSWSDKDFSGVNFSHGELKDFDFSNFNLSGANFDSANLSGAVLTNANIQGASFVGSVGNDSAANPAHTVSYDMLMSTRSWKDKDFSGVKLGASNLKGFDFSNFNLSGTSFLNANLSGAVLTNANIQGANFYGLVGNDPNANPDHTVTHAMLMSTKSWENKDFSGVEFGTGDLSNFDFSYMNLAGADFMYTNLQNANLTGADLRGAIMTDVKNFNADDHNNLIDSDGKILNLTLSSADDALTIRGGTDINAYLDGTTATISGDATLTLTQNAVLELTKNTQLTLANDGHLKLVFDAADPSSLTSIVIEAGSSLTLDPGAFLDITIENFFLDGLKLNVLSWENDDDVADLLLLLEDTTGYRINGKTLAEMGIAAVIDHDNNTFSIIPEPSTATLSLLALAGLLARRRRKAA